MPNGVRTASERGRSSSFGAEKVACLDRPDDDFECATACAHVGRDKTNSEGAKRNIRLMPKQYSLGQKFADTLQIGSMVHSFVLQKMDH